MSVEKTTKFILTFANTHDVIRMEKLCKESGIPGRIIPVPREISASCGLAWMAPASDKETVETFVASTGISPEGRYEMMF